MVRLRGLVAKHFLSMDVAQLHQKRVFLDSSIIAFNSFIDRKAEKMWQGRFEKFLVAFGAIFPPSRAANLGLKLQ